MTAVWMRFRAEVRSQWKTWLPLAVVAGIAGGFVIAAVAGASRTDSALARHLRAYHLRDAAISFDNSTPHVKRTYERIAASPLVQAAALDREVAYCARDAQGRSLIDNGPEATWFVVSIDGRDGAALDRPKLLAGRAPDPTHPREALLDSRSAQRLGVRPGDVIPIRVFPFFGPGQLGEFHCDPKNRNPHQAGIPTRRVVREILVSCPQRRSCERARALIGHLYAQLAGGASFARLAREFSDDPTRSAGGRQWIGGDLSGPWFDAATLSTAFRLRTGAISRPLRSSYGWQIVQPLSPLLPAGPLVRLKVVGIRATTDPYPIGKVLLTPAFNRLYGFDSVYYDREIQVRLRRGAADLPAFRRKFLGGGPFLDPESDPAAKIERSIHEQAQALRLAAAAGALLVFVLIAQAFARVASFAAAQQTTLRALGMSRDQLVALGAARAAAIALPAAALAAGVAVALSPLTPIGLARELEPRPGFALDLLDVAVGSLFILVAMVAAGVYAASLAATEPVGTGTTPSATRRVPMADSFARWGFPPTFACGVRLALARGRRTTAVPVGATLLASVTAVSVVAVSLTFTASLQHLLATPGLYGQNWDYRSNYGVPSPASVRADPSLSDVAWGGFQNSALLNGRQFGVVAMDNLKGRIDPVVIAGRAPEGPDEILLAPKTLDSLGLRVGDSVQVRVVRTRRMRIVGRGVVPEATFNELGWGAAMTWQAYSRLAHVPSQSPPQPYSFEARIALGADRRATLARLERRFVWPAPGPPQTIADFGGVRTLPLVVSALLAAIATAALAHALVMAIRRRRRHLAALKTLGFDRRQIQATIAWQATTFAAIGLLVGLPLGVALGRWAWTLLAEQIGVVPDSVTPVPLILLVVPAAVLLANLVAILPARAAAMTPAASVLRAE